jgi:hypothetical protein
VACGSLKDSGGGWLVERKNLRVTYINGWMAGNERRIIDHEFVVLLGWCREAAGGALIIILRLILFFVFISSYCNNKKEFPRQFGSCVVFCGE